jgi:hypothetical protein
MITSIFITAVIVGAGAYALSHGKRGGLIVRRPYNNRYNDAAGARDEHFG